MKNAINDANDLLSEVGGRVTILRYKEHKIGYGSFFITAIIGKKLYCSSKKANISEAVKEILTQNKLDKGIRPLITGGLGGHHSMSAKQVIFALVVIRVTCFSGE